MPFPPPPPAASKVARRVPSAPFANSNEATTIVGVRTSIVCPAGALSDDALRCAVAGDAGYAADRTEQVDHRGQVIGRHIFQRTATGLEEIDRIGVPRMRAAGGTNRHSGDRLPDRPVIDQRATGLQTAAEHRVGRATQSCAGRRGEREQGSGVLDAQRQRLFAIDRFAGLQSRLGQIEMNARRCEVDDQLH